MSEKKNTRGQRESVSCSDVQQHLLQMQHPREALPSAQQEHLVGCQACQTLQAELLLLDDLTRKQAPELPAGFELSLRRRLKDEARSAAPVRRMRWRRAVLAAAALVLVSAGSLFVASRWPGPSQAKPGYYRLHLAIQSTQEYKQVLFDVDLPQGVRSLAGAGQVLGAESLKWQSALHEGLNELDLPLVAERTTGKVFIQLSAGNERWAGSVTLDSTAQGTSARSEAHAGTKLAWAVTVGTAQVTEGVQ